MLQVGDLTSEERIQIEERIAASGRPFEDVLTQATTMLSGLSRCAGLLLAAKQEVPLKHVEFVAISPGKALAILVGADGSVENRLIDTPLGLPPSALTEVANYLSAKLQGRTLDAARGEILKEIEEQRPARFPHRANRRGGAGHAVRPPAGRRQCHRGQDPDRPGRLESFGRH
jgi:heat-inducible transcriptional repressor